MYFQLCEKSGAANLSQKRDGEANLVQMGNGEANLICQYPYKYSSVHSGVWRGGGGSFSPE